MGPKISFILAFAAGFASFFSPCFLPLVPAYLIYITGLSFDEVSKIRVNTAIHSLLFIIGFSLVFVSLGMVSSFLGRILFEFRDIIRVCGGILLIIFGLYLSGWIRIQQFDYERRLRLAAKPSGYLGSIVIGVLFALGWTPCVGPALSSILVIASQEQHVIYGAFLLLCFSLGLGVPLFLASLALNTTISLIKVLNPYLIYIKIMLGFLLMGSGIALFFNLLPRIV
jgi:cytochrome c-type biogenesis protein